MPTSLLTHFGHNLGWRLLAGQCQLCLLPSERQRDLCKYCEAALPWTLEPCPSCGLSPYPRHRSIAPQRQGRVCVECSHAGSPIHPATRVVAPLAYRAGAQWLAQRQKVRRGQVSGRILAELLGDGLLNAYADRPLPDALVAVPLHWLRHLQRGHNQAELLAHWVGLRMRLPILEQSLRRTRATPSQQGLNQRARQQNMRDAFVATKRLHGELIAIVDDVLTTGATARGVAKALLKAGAGEVHVWTPTRALLKM